MRCLVALVVAGSLCVQVSAQTTKDKAAAEAYVARLAAIVNRMTDAETPKHPELMETQNLKLRYTVGPTGHVQSVEILSANPHRRGAETLARLIKDIVFPPYPKELLQSGANRIDGILDWRGQFHVAETKTYNQYNLEVHKMLQDDVLPAFNTSRHPLAVDYEFYLNEKGRVVRFSAHAKTGGTWAEQVLVRSIRRLKFPAVPAKVFQELGEKPPLRIYGTMEWEPK
jgi:hypothetical protein